MRVIDAVKNLAVAIKGSGEVSDIDTDRIAETIQYMADNWEEIKAGMGTGGTYVLPAATTTALGGVKKAAAVSSVSAADATAAGDAYDKTTAQSAVFLANANKAAINALISKLKAAGIVE